MEGRVRGNPPNFAPLEFMGRSNMETKVGSTSTFVAQTVYPRPVVGLAQGSIGSPYPRPPVGVVPTLFPAPSSGPSVWTSPFGAAVAALGSDSQTVSGALTAAVEAETHVRRGLAAAHYWWPAMIDYLRGYFAVSHSSIAQKLGALFIPPLGYRLLWKSSAFARRSSKASSSDMLDESSDRTDKRAYHDIHHLGPDLYLPIMSYLTYVLLYGLSKATFEDFHPELLSSTASYAAVLTIIEVIVSFAVFYVVGVQLPMLDVLSVAGQKFESLVAILLSGLFIGVQSTLYWSIFLYFGFCAGHAYGCELRHRPQYEWGSQRSRPMGFLYILLVLSLFQLEYWGKAGYNIYNKELCTYSKLKYIK